MQSGTGSLLIFLILTDLLLLGSSRLRNAIRIAAAQIVLDDAEVAAITALGRPDGRLFDADPRTHEES